MVYGKEWADAAEEGCAYVAGKQKCECKKHKKMRKHVKSINFGLAYGMSEFKLSSTVYISVEEARTLIRKYFNAFPAIHGFLTILGNYGKRHGMTKTFRPYLRRRYFPQWNENINEPDFRKIAGEIERQSKNMPIQGAGADLTKYALYLVRNEIRRNNYPVKIVMQVHDQIDTICPREFAQEWRMKLKGLMEQAAITSIPEGLLKADVSITDVWTKD